MSHSSRVDYMSRVVLCIVSTWSVAEMLPACDRKDADIGDLVLLVDYIISLQYFNIFRTAPQHECYKGELLDVNEDQDAVRKRIQDDTYITRFLQGLKDVLQPYMVGSGPTRLWTVAQSMLYSELKAFSNPTDGVEKPALEPEHLLLAQPEALGALFNAKLAGEAQRWAKKSGQPSTKHDAFNETDRIVKRLLQLQHPANEAAGEIAGLRWVHNLRLGDQLHEQ